MNTTTTEGQVIAPLDHARASMLYRPDMPDPTPLVSLNNRLANEWLTWLRDTAGREPQTVYNYASLVARYLDECVGNRALDGVPPGDVDEWLRRPRRGRAEGKVAAPATRARNVAILRSFYKWLHARGLVSVNLGEQLVAPKVNNKHPRAIPDHIWQVAIEAAEEPLICGILGLGFFLGLRRMEIATIHADHVDVSQQSFTHFVRKGGGDDILPVGEILRVFDAKMPHLYGRSSGQSLWAFITVLKENPLGADGTLLGLPNVDQVNRTLAQYLKRIGLKGAFTPHALRHSFVTNLLRCGVGLDLVSGLANHSDLNVTMRYVKGGGGRLSEWLANNPASPLDSPTVNVSDWRQ